MEPTVVVACDPAAADDAAVDFAVSIAEVLAARLVIAGAGAGGTLAERLVRWERDEADAGAPEAAVRSPTLRRLGAEALRVTGPTAADALQRLLARERPVLAVIGSARGAGYGRVLAGTVGERVLHGSPCPVAIVPRGYVPRPLGRVCVGLSPSPEGALALAVAASLARAAGARLHVMLVLTHSPSDAEARSLAGMLAALHAAAPARAASAATAAGDPRGTPSAAVAGILRGAMASETPAGILRGAVHAAAAHPAAGAWPGAGRGARAPLEVDPDAVIGDPADALVRASEHAGLLVLGSRAYGPAGVVMPGGVARQVIDRARCPVLLVPRAALAAAA